MSQTGRNDLVNLGDITGAADPIDLASFPADTVVTANGAAFDLSKVVAMMRQNTRLLQATRSEVMTLSIPADATDFNGRRVIALEDLAYGGMLRIDAPTGSKPELDYDINLVVNMMAKNRNSLMPKQAQVDAADYDSPASRWQQLNTRFQQIRRSTSKRTAPGSGVQTQDSLIAKLKKNIGIGLNLGLMIFVGLLVLDIVNTMVDPANMATANLLQFLQDPTNGYTAAAATLRGIDPKHQLELVNLVFIIMGGSFGFDFARRYTNGSLAIIGIVLGILVFHGIQFLTMIGLAILMH